MENKTYSINEKASKSFGTFILTLSISLIVFSAVYYFMTKSSLDSDQFSVSQDNAIEENKVTSDFNVQEEKQDEAVLKNDNETSVFGQIADKNPNVVKKEVLAGATVAETPQTTTSNPAPDTGVVGITFGLIFSLVLFISAIVFVYNNPRNIALSSFEKRSTKGL